MVIRTKYANENINMSILIDLIEKLTTKGTIEIKEQVNPLDFLQRIIKKP